MLLEGMTMTNVSREIKEIEGKETTLCLKVWKEE